MDSKERTRTRASADSSRATFSGAVLFYGLGALLIFAPLFRGGYRPLPLLIMELAALLLLAGLAWKPLATGQALSWPLRVFLGLVLLLPLAQLLPVPMALWADLPGRAFYADALRQVGDAGVGFDWRAISLIPSATEAAWLALLPPLAVFIVASRLDEQRLLILVLVFLGMAVGQALLGLIQYGDGPDSLFRLGNTWMAGSAVGTYVNRNSLAGLLEMALPLALALLVATVGHGTRYHVGRRRGLRQWLARFSVARLNRAVLFGLAALVILLGLIFTRSRTGVSMAMLGILLCTLLLSNRLGGRNVYGLIGTFTAAGIGLASLIGLAPVWSRFTYADPMEDGRVKIFEATLQAIGQFFPFGTGAGTYQAVMHRFHPIDFPGLTINHAHNDYLEWILGNGLSAILLIAFWLLLYLRQWGRVWKHGDWQPFRFVQVGAGIALLLMMLHTLVDFNLHIPANAAFTAFLAALFLHRPLKEESRQSRQREQPDRSSSETVAERPVPPPREIPPENQQNPFAL